MHPASRAHVDTRIAKQPFSKVGSWPFSVHTNVRSLACPKGNGRLSARRSGAEEPQSTAPWVDFDGSSRWLVIKPPCGSQGCRSLAVDRGFSARWRRADASRGPTD